MRIILFHQYFLGKNDPGGSRWNQLTKYFTEDKTSTVDVMAGNIHYATGKQLGAKVWYNKEMIDENITVHRTWTYSGYNVNFIGRLIGYFSYTFSSLLKSLFLKKSDIIIVTSPSIFVGISALVLSKVKKIPFIFEVRDLWPESAVATGVLTNKHLINILFFLEKTLYKYATKIIVLTPAFKKDIENRFPKYKNKIETITNAADFDLMQAGEKNNWVRVQYEWGNKKVFTYLGAHGLANDLMQVVEVARKFKDNHNILFVLLGDGMQKPLLKEKVKEYDLGNVQFIDSVSKNKVGDFINASDVCMAILKKTDTFKTVYPNKIFDYMSCKKPVLVTIDGITRDLVKHANCGFYSEPENLEDLKYIVDIIVKMNDSELEKLGENGYQYAKKYFDREKLAEQYMRVIKEVLNA